MPIVLDGYTLVSFVACAVVMLALIHVTGGQFTKRTVLVWFAASLIIAPFARKLILSIAHKIHIGAVDVLLYTNLA